MPTIVRYNAVRGLARRATYAHPYGRYVRTGMRMYNTGRAFAPYARTAIRAFRGYRKRKRSNAARKRVLRRRVGESIGTGNAKSDTLRVDNNLDTRTLYSHPLLNVVKGNSINERERDIVNFRGIKFCMSIMNKIPTTIAQNGEQLYFNYAILSGKAEEAKLGLPVVNFFRSMETGLRGQNFAIDLSALDFHCLPINTDLYNVHMHKRLKIGPYSSTEGKNTRTFEWYTPLKRQIRYNGASEFPVGKQMFLVYWCDMQGVPQLAPAIVNQVDLQLKILKYFKEPKN